MAIAYVLQQALKDCGISGDAVQLIGDPNRAVTMAFMRMKEYVDVLIPRGGRG